MSVFTQISCCAFTPGESIPAVDGVSVGLSTGTALNSEDAEEMLPGNFCPLSLSNQFLDSNAVCCVLPLMWSQAISLALSTNITLVGRRRGNRLSVYFKPGTNLSFNKVRRPTGTPGTKNLMR
ncbi:MAG: hypothetical protein A4E62_02874 [Syntrophorhabdus sp. PtaU1.Bin002]|nr:MAG: hypothetical protein A4E58_01943 [Syntrophorhabdus sp. PtaB.Bin006]OPY64278.1 MAG: hypothetical protein A4E62_02874 [Syntrophorhabdus sp. PtaU1.Bin002]